MAPFPTFRLPHVAQREVFRHSDFGDLLYLSFCSKKAKDLVRTSRTAIQHLGVFFQQMMPRTRRPVVMFDTNEPENFDDWKKTVKIMITPVRSEYRANAIATRGFDGIDVFLEKDPFFCTVITENYVDAADRIMEYLLDVFGRPTQFWLSIDQDHILLGNFFWKYQRTVKELGVAKTRPTDRKLSVEEITFLLEEVTVTESMNIDIPVVDGFRWSRSFRQPRLLINYPNWVDFDVIQNSESSLIVLNNCQMPEAATLNNLLKNWMNHEKMKDLKEMNLLFSDESDEITDEFIEDVFDDIDLEVDAEINAKIQRIDGAVAEVSIYMRGFQLQVCD